MARVLIVLPQRDYDPTEAGVPWQLLERSGHQVSFATPDDKLKRGLEVLAGLMG